MDKPNFKKLMRLSIQALTNFPYIEEDFDALTNYELLCKVVGELNKVSDNQKTLDNNITLLIEAFNELKNYVDNYFENLDVQEEINNKLDEMAESGQLTDIIAQYLGLAGVLAFNTVADMKEATNLVNGSICKTLGYYNINDGGAGNYKIRTITTSDVVDEGYIIAINETLVAELIIENNTINVNQYGLKANDNTFDNSELFESLLDKCSENGNHILFDKGDYYFNTAITFNHRLKNINVKGQSAQYTGSETGTALIYTGSGWFLTFDKLWRCNFSDLELQGDSGAYGIYLNDTAFYTKFTNIILHDFDRGIKVASCGYLWLNTINVTCENNTSEYGISIGGINDKQPEYLFIDNFISEDGDIYSANIGIELLGGIHIFINNVDIVKKNKGIYINPITYLNYWKITNVDLTSCAYGMHLWSENRTLWNGVVDNVVYNFRLNALSTDRFIKFERGTNRIIQNIDFRRLMSVSLDGSMGDYSIEETTEGALDKVTIDLCFNAYDQHCKLLYNTSNFQPLVNFPQPLKGNYRIFKTTAGTNSTTINLLTNSPFVVAPKLLVKPNVEGAITSYSLSNTNGGNLVLTLNFAENYTGNLDFYWEIPACQYGQKTV